MSKSLASIAAVMSTNPRLYRHYSQRNWSECPPEYPRSRPDISSHVTGTISDSRQTPLNQLYPRSSQKPPGKRFVTNMAVIHFGFLNPSLVGMRSFSGYPYLGARI